MNSDFGRGDTDLQVAGFDSRKLCDFRFPFYVADFYYIPSLLHHKTMSLTVD